MKFLNSLEITQNIKVPQALVNALADNCPACGQFKEYLPDLIKHADLLGIPVYNIKVEAGNEEFFAKYPIETLPYTLVFDNGEFVGGDSFDKDSFNLLVNALSGNINVVAE